MNVDRNRYSVECRYAGRVATVRVYAERIVLMSEDQMSGDHPRHFGRGHVEYNPWHYVPALKRKPGALRNGAPCKDWNLPTAMRRLRERLAKHVGGDRQFVEILSMVALYSLEAVTKACAAALDDEVVSSEYVVNLLHRAAAPAPVAPLQVPEALKLSISSLPPTAIATTGCCASVPLLFLSITHPSRVMQIQELTEKLKALRLRGVASALEESLTALSQKKLAPTTWLAQLLQAEMADRQARSCEYQLRLARFPVPRTSTASTSASRR